MKILQERHAIMFSISITHWRFSHKIPQFCVLKILSSDYFLSGSTSLRFSQRLLTSNVFHPLLLKNISFTGHKAPIQNIFAICRNSRPEVFCKKGVPSNFTKLTGKHLCQSLFYNKLAGLRPGVFL